LFLKIISHGYPYGYLNYKALDLNTCQETSVYLENTIFTGESVKTVPVLFLV